MNSGGTNMYHHGMPLLHLAAAHGVVALAAFGAVLAAGLGLPRLRRALHRT